MLNAISRNYFWRGMIKDIEYYVNNCEACLLVKRMKAGIVPEMHHYEPKSFNTRWHLDFLEKLKTSKDGYKHCLVAIESASRFVLVEPVKDLTAETVVDFVFKRIFCMFSVPKIIFTDRGAAFRSKMLEFLNKKMGVETKHSLPYHSQGNGICESDVKRVETILRNYVCNDGSDWPAYCYSTQLAINTSCNRTTNESPYYVVFNRDPTLPFDLNLGIALPQGLNNTHTTEDLATRCADTFQKATENHKLMIQSFKRYYDMEVHDPFI